MSAVTEVVQREGHGVYPPEVQGFFMAGRPRVATCSGVCWFRGYHLAAVHLAESHLRIYRFHPRGAAPARLELLHQVSDGICFPEDVGVSPDGTLLAVTHSLTDGVGVTLHRLDAGSLALGPGEPLRRTQHGWAFHGVRFSADSRHLAFTEIGETGRIEVVRAPGGERTCLLPNSRAPMKPKSLAFSPDGRFVVVAWALNNGKNPLAFPLSAMLAIHRYDAANGVIATEPLVELRGLGSLEMCTFLAGGRIILACNQAADVVEAFSFDEARRSLASAGIFADGIPFPHGLDASADGAFVAMTGYGDDVLRIDKVR